LYARVRSIPRDPPTFRKCADIKTLACRMGVVTDMDACRLAVIPNSDKNEQVPHGMILYDCTSQS